MDDKMDDKWDDGQKAVALKATNPFVLKDELNIPILEAVKLYNFVRGIKPKPPPLSLLPVKEGGSKRRRPKRTKHKVHRTKKRKLSKKKLKKSKKKRKKTRRRRR